MSEQSLVFIGCGAATQKHASTLRSLAPDLELWFASRAGEKARAFNQRFNGAGWFHGYDAAFADSHSDVAFVATPPATHAELALDALASGKHVIVEKPAFLTTAEFDTVALASAATDRQVMVAENYFYKPVAVALRRIIASGDLGSIRLVLVNALKWQRPAGWRADPAASGGPLIEGGIHWINLIANLGPQIVSLETAECAGPLTTITTARYDNGAAAVLAYSWEMRSPLRGLRLSRIYGTAGSVAFESNGVALMVNGRRPRVVLPGLRDIAGYRAMFRDFFSALDTGQTPMFTLERARREIELLSNATQSRTAGKHTQSLRSLPVPHTDGR